MGQKVNPISMRLQVNKDWRSKWFAGKRECQVVERAIAELKIVHTRRDS